MKIIVMYEYADRKHERPPKAIRVAKENGLTVALYPYSDEKLAELTAELNS